MGIITYKLEELYAVERSLSRERVEFYKRIGKGGLLEEISRTPIVTEWTLSQRQIFLEIVDGCHRAKALLHLGISRIDVETINDKTELAEDEEISVKLSDLKELEPPEYESYLRSMGIEPWKH